MRFTFPAFLIVAFSIAWMPPAQADVPEPLIPECTEPLAEGVPDLRGLWRITNVENFFHFVTEGMGRPKWQARLGESLRGNEERFERIEQCGLKVAIGFKRGAIIVEADGKTPSETEGYEDRNPLNATAQYDGETLVIINSRDEGKIRIVRQIVEGKLVAKIRPDSRDDDFLPMINTYERVDEQ